MSSDKKKRLKLRVRGVKNVTELKVEVPQKWLTKEVGSFAFGYCKSCDWVGPGRRAREKARNDAEAHAAQCKGKAKVTVAKGEIKHKS